jgi:outer membrane protein TolC
VFDGLARVSRIKATGATMRSSQANLGYQESILVQDVSEAFYNVLRASAQVDVAKQTEDVANQELDRSRTYFDVGIATRSDVLQAQVRYSQTQLETVRARNAERQAFVLLTHLMNIPGAQRFELAFDLPTEITDLTTPKLDTLLADAQQKRLDLVASQEALDAAGFRVTEARSGYWPQLGIFGSMSYNKSETPYRFGAQTNRAYAWGAALTWNLFDRFQTRNASRRALADKRRAEYELRQNKLTMESELSAYLNNLTEATESYSVAKETVAQAEEDLRLATERFKVGAGTSLDVINAQQSLGRARADVVNAVADYYIAQARIDRASGQ